MNDSPAVDVTVRVNSTVVTCSSCIKRTCLFAIVDIVDPNREPFEHTRPECPYGLKAEWERPHE